MGDPDLFQHNPALANGGLGSKKSASSIQPLWHNSHENQMSFQNIQ